MKSLLVLLCVVALSQARSAVKVPESREMTTLPAQGVFPWVSHLRVAVDGSGFLRSCGGTLIDHKWILTSVACVGKARFVWASLGVISVPHPDVVIETSIVKEHSSGLALVDLNRNVAYTSNIKPAGIGFRLWIPSDTNFCGFSNASERLQCRSVKDGHLQVSQQDLGGALMYGETVYGVMTSVDDYEIPAWNRLWIQWETGLLLRSADAAEDVIQG